MVIDCDECAVRGPACGQCVVSVLLGGTPDGVELDEAERQAVATLAEAGLVPPLRLVPIWTVRDREMTARRQDTG